MSGTAHSGGRNAKSPEHHRALGTFQPSRHAGFETPDLPHGRPAPPKPLTKAERAEWDRMVARLERAKTSSSVDDAALYQYVQLFAETEAIKTDRAGTRRLLRDLSRAMRSLTGDTLVTAIDHLLQLKKALARDAVQLRMGHLAIRQYLVEFGMTPSSRTRVKIPKDDAAPSRLVAFMGGKASGQ